MQRSRKVMTLVVTALSALALLWTADAQALEFQIGARAKGGGGSTSLFNDNDVDAFEDPNAGFAFGGQGFALIGFNRLFSFGLNFDYDYIDTEGEFVDYGFHLPSVGLMTRLNLSNYFALDGWVNYVFGSLNADYTTALGREDSDYSMNGVEFAIQPTLRIQLEPYRTYFEFGGFLSWSYNTISDFTFTPRGTSVSDTRDIEWSVVQYGVTLGVTFDFGDSPPPGGTYQRQYGDGDEGAQRPAVSYYE